ncbi:MAG: HEAT repeat domain-containing protein [Calditrichia bacterium]
MHEALGKIGQRSSSHKVGEFLKFRDIGIRKAATKALSGYGTSEYFSGGISYLLHQILREDDPETSWRAVRAVSHGALRSFADYGFCDHSQISLTRYGLKGIQRIILSFRALAAFSGVEK